METAATIICAVLALAFLGAGIPKVLRVPKMREEIRRWRLPEGLLPLIGVTEVVAAVLLIAGIVSDSEGPALVGAVILICVAAGAVATHIRISDPPPKMAPAAVLGILAIIATVLLAG